MSHTLYLGIDVAKDSFDVASDPAGLVLSLANDATGRRRLVDALKPQPVALIVLEATGGYERSLVADLLDAGHKVVVAKVCSTEHTLSRQARILVWHTDNNKRQRPGGCPDPSPSGRGRAAGPGEGGMTVDSNSALVS